MIHLQVMRAGSNSTRVGQGMIQSQVSTVTVLQGVLVRHAGTMALLTRQTAHSKAVGEAAFLIIVIPVSLGVPKQFIDQKITPR